MRRKLRNRFLTLLTEKERREQRRITYTEIAKFAESSIGVISRWAKNEIERYDAPMVEAMCEYFECEVGDLLYLESMDDVISN
jgi:transcriptional regulator with XRE-family HTH domain